MTTTYVPGVCNIGPAEVKSRIIGGWLGVVLTLIIGAALLKLDVPMWTRLVLFFPAAIGALGFLQAGFHFCVAFGTKGVFNVSDEVGKTESISQKEFRKMDQQKSIAIISYAVIIGIVVAIGALFV